jgi:hypothetical protein
MFFATKREWTWPPKTDGKRVQPSHFILDIAAVTTRTTRTTRTPPPLVSRHIIISEPHQRQIKAQNLKHDG